MQPKRIRRQPWFRQRWTRRSRASYVKLSLVLTFAVAIALFGRHHGGPWRSPSANDPFPPTVTGYGKPIDGDSLWVGAAEVRLKGIDAPEWKQRCQRDSAPWNCGEAAREELLHSIGRDDVTCAISERDTYGRMLGRCMAGGRDLNAGMVASGMAVAYGNYWNEQAKARAGRRGLWAGDFENPKDWRAKQAAEEGK
jgi:endonuclease YncB( thermonuclease family)